jgi:DNA invertase Pin-like site-specific DNA recombinase
MPKVIAYIRVSTDTQDTQNQKIKILEYAQKHNLKIDSFIETTVSSTKSQEKRKITDLEELLTKGDTVITTEYSRLHRNQVEAFIFIHAHLNKEVNFIFTNQQELTTNGVPTALKSLMFSIYGYVAQTERETNSTRTKMGLERAKAQGKTLGRPKGSTGSSKLDGFEKEVAEMLDASYGDTQIARAFKREFNISVTSPTVRDYRKSREHKISKFRNKI